MHNVRCTAIATTVWDCLAINSATLTSLYGLSSSATDLNMLSGLSSLNIHLSYLNGLTAQGADLNLLTGMSSSLGKTVASKAVVLDANRQLDGFQLKAGPCVGASGYVTPTSLANICQISGLSSGVKISLPLPTPTGTGVDQAGMKYSYLVPSDNSINFFMIPPAGYLINKWWSNASPMPIPATAAEVQCTSTLNSAGAGAGWSCTFVQHDATPMTLSSSVQAAPLGLIYIGTELRHQRPSDATEHSDHWRLLGDRHHHSSCLRRRHESIHHQCGHIELYQWCWHNLRRWNPLTPHGLHRLHRGDLAVCASGRGWVGVHRCHYSQLKTAPAKSSLRVGG